MDNRNDPGIRPGMADRSANGAQGLNLTSRLLENYQLLHEYAQKGTPGGSEPSGTDVGAILDALRSSREDTAAVVGEIDRAMTAVRVAAIAGGYAYKVDAFERRYIKGQTYEQIADAMNSGRNSPRRWCDEIMRQMAVRLFGVNGISC